MAREKREEAAPGPDPAPLEESCPACLGKGTVHNVQWDDWRRRRDAGSSEPPPWRNEEEACPTCSGAGGVPTAAGQGLLDFVRRHLRGRPL